MSGPPYSVTYTMSEAAYLAAIARVMARVLLRVMAVAVPLLIVYGWWLGFGAVAIMAGLVLSWCAAMLFINRWRARGIYREQRSYREPRHFNFGEDGWASEQDSGVFRGGWDDIVKWDESADAMLLYPNRQMFLLLTKPEIGGEALGFMKARLAGSGLTRPRRRRR